MTSETVSKSFRILHPINIFQRNVNKLFKICPSLLSLKAGDAIKSKSDGWMDLNIDILDKTDRKIRLALSHYYNCNGDMISDPDMEMDLLLDNDGTPKWLEALTYQDPLGFQRVYLDENRFSPRLKTSLNSFLGKWLTNLFQQGHRLDVANLVD